MISTGFAVSPQTISFGYVRAVYSRCFQECAVYFFSMQDGTIEEVCFWPVHMV